MLPNIITGVRIIGTVLLLFFPIASIPFISIYLVCGISDVLDGFLARKLQCESKIGAKLDSIADVLFLVVVAIRLIPFITWVNWIVVWVICIGILKIVAIAIISIRFHKLGLIHTYMNKITGVTLFFVPVFYTLPIANEYIAFVCGVATLTAVEDFILSQTMEEFDPNRKGLKEFNK